MQKLHSFRFVPPTLLALFLVQPLCAAPRTPRVGSSERRAIMDAMRKVVGKRSRKKIIFTADHLKVEKGWAYFAGSFAYADGTRPGEEYNYGTLSSVLRFQNKKWRVLYDVHNGDVIEPEMMSRFPRAPKAIFKRTYR